MSSWWQRAHNPAVLWPLRTSSATRQMTSRARRIVANIPRDLAAAGSEGEWPETGLVAV